MDIQPENDNIVQKVQLLWQFIINDSRVGMFLFAAGLIIRFYYLMKDRTKKSKDSQTLHKYSSKQKQLFTNRLEKQQKMVDQQDQTTHQKLRRENIIREMRQNSRRNYKFAEKQEKNTFSLRNNPQIFLQQKSIALSKIKMTPKQMRIGYSQTAENQINSKLEKMFDLSTDFTQPNIIKEKQTKKLNENNQKRKNLQIIKEQSGKDVSSENSQPIRSDSRKTTLQRTFFQNTNNTDSPKQKSHQTMNVSFGQNNFYSGTLLTNKQKITNEEALFSFKKSGKEEQINSNFNSGFINKGFDIADNNNNNIFGNSLGLIGKQQNTKTQTKVQTKTQSKTQNGKQGFSLFGSSSQNNGSIKPAQSIPSIPSVIFGSPSNPIPNLLSKDNKPLAPPSVPSPQSIHKPISQPKPIKTSMPQPAVSPISPPKDKLTAQEFIDSYIKFAEKLKQQVPISTKLQNLLGARSSPNDILIEAKSLIGTIDKNDDKQITTFGLRLFDTIVNKFINNSNVKSGLERVPPKSRTDQCEKNSINCYILALNIYRLMNQGKKVWVIVFGKLLKLLQFLYKRKQDLKSYHELELIQSGYIKKFKEVHSKYLSRIDFLIYMLLGMTSFDPILILRQVEQKERSVEKSRQQIQSWKNVWSYNEFWCLVCAVLNNKHESYSKPIFFMNLLYTLYPRIYQHKGNPVNFKQENDLFLAILEKSKKYLQNFKKIKEVKTLSVEQQTRDYEYDGDDFIKSIKVLDNRMPQKGLQIKMSARDYESKANIFYYFSKEK